MPFLLYFQRSVGSSPAEKEIYGKSLVIVSNYWQFVKLTGLASIQV